MSESVKAPETKAPAKKTQAVTEAKTEAVLYVGPTISGIAITGTVYTTIPEAAKAAKADAPMILNLFIPIREYGEAERMIREKRGYVYSAYAEAQKRVEEAYRDESRWAKMAMLNTACSGKFTSDRTIQQYVDEIWHLKKEVIEAK